MRPETRTSETNPQARGQGLKCPVSKQDTGGFLTGADGSGLGAQVQGWPGRCPVPSAQCPVHSAQCLGSGEPEVLRYNVGPRASSPDTGPTQASGAGATAPTLASTACRLTPSSGGCWLLSSNVESCWVPAGAGEGCAAGVKPCLLSPSSPGPTLTGPRPPRGPASEAG